MAPPLQPGVVGPYLAHGTQDTRPQDLAASVSFGEVVHGMTPASKLKLPLMKFHVVCSNDEDDINVLRGLNWRLRMLLAVIAAQSMRHASSASQIGVS
jgi:hypothetical protein